MRHIVVADEVATALAAGRAVVALESTLLEHGLPPSRNREVADRLEAAARAAGAVPATIAVLPREDSTLGGANLRQRCRSRQDRTTRPGER